MKFRKIGFVASQKPEAIEALKKLKKLYKNVPPNKADIIVALGGDGTILKCLHDYLKRKIPIYGMNRGFVGFLMNQKQDINLLNKLNEAEETVIHPLKMYAKKLDGTIEHYLAVNEISILRFILETEAAKKLKN